MVDAKEVATPLVASSTLRFDDGSPLVDATKYHSVISALKYVSMTCPDIAFVVNKLAQFLQRPSTLHCVATKRLLCFLKDTLYYGLLIRKNCSTSIHAYSDANWAGKKDDFISTTANFLCCIVHFYYEQTKMQLESFLNLERLELHNLQRGDQ